MLSLESICPCLAFAAWEYWPMPPIPAPCWKWARSRPWARTLGIEVANFEIGRAAVLAPAFEAFKNQAQATYVVADPLVFINRVQINILALGARLPTMHAAREYVEAGGLMSYGPNFNDLFHRSAELVDKILRGDEAGRYSNRATDQARSSCQSDDGENPGSPCRQCCSRSPTR